ncbi:MAG: tRNA uridine-5-carboxymethylaminomethyl(34) synthesis GTPase MnmE [Gammaproteobacteria bacterium]|nr:tRNA uridine-5-carboxymethylaminomethyl(34) synthesis GTPase MnmE [Gammaproteobacteria bacterium]
MYLQRKSDTIFAELTPAGKGSVSVFRISGQLASYIHKHLIHGKRSLPRIASVRWLHDPETGKRIDRGIVLWFPGPKTFTGEDIVELHTHGGRSVREAMINALNFINGVRLAEPGEFSARAFINGKVDLTEAEGIADLISAETEAQRLQALRQMSGGLKELYETWRVKLIKLSAYLEAEMDFSDEALPSNINESVYSNIRELVSDIEIHLLDKNRGQKIRHGIQIALLGAPNAGKSSLLNILAKKDVAIVSDISGTTRDVVKINLDLEGIPVSVSDTAGIHSASGKIEKEGIKRSYIESKSSDIRIIILDGETWPEVPSEIIDLINDDSILLLNKSDLVKISSSNVIKQQPKVISCLKGIGISEFTKELTEMVKNRYDIGENPLITRERHRKAASDCLEALKRSLNVDQIELLAEDLRLAIYALARITGRVDVEDILDVVFRDFCIGK